MGSLRGELRGSEAQLACQGDKLYPDFTFCSLFQPYLRALALAMGGHALICEMYAETKNPHSVHSTNKKL